MNFSLVKSISILERAPSVYYELLNGLENDWVYANEGKESWSAFDIIGHLILGEMTDWIPRCRIMLSEVADKSFIPFDMFGHQDVCKGKNLEELLLTFSELRKKNIQELRSWNLSEEDFRKTGIHPEFGEITLKQHLATWVIHDLSHLNQISRVMVKHYQHDVGPWTKYFSILRNS